MASPAFAKTKSSWGHLMSWVILKRVQKLTKILKLNFCYHNALILAICQKLNLRKSQNQIFRKRNSSVNLVSKSSQVWTVWFLKIITRIWNHLETCNHLHFERLGVSTLSKVRIPILGMEVPCSICKIRNQSIKCHISRQ